LSGLRTYNVGLGNDKKKFLWQNELEITILNINPNDNPLNPNHVLRDGVGRIVVFSRTAVFRVEAVKKIMQTNGIFERLENLNEK